MPAPTLKVLIAALTCCEAEIRKLDTEIARRAEESDVARRPMTVPGIGPLIATVIAALAPPPYMLRKVRDFAAWLGLVPRQHSTGGKQRLGATTKIGDRSLRRLLILAANSAITKRHVGYHPVVCLSGSLNRTLMVRQTDRGIREHRRATGAAVRRSEPGHVLVQPDQQRPALAKRR